MGGGKTFAVGTMALGVVFSLSLAGCNALLGNQSWTEAQDAAAGEDGPSGFLRTDATEAGLAPEGSSPVTAPADSGTGAVDSSGPARMDAAPPPSDSALPPDTGAPSDLNAALVLPAPGGSPCLLSVGDGECVGEQTCRISGMNSGSCESFNASDMQAGWPCMVDTDCGDGMQCYSGECKILCPLDEGTCTGGCECFDVGNETTGICCPGT